MLPQKTPYINHDDKYEPTKESKEVAQLINFFQSIKNSNPTIIVGIAIYGLFKIQGHLSLSDESHSLPLFGTSLFQLLLTLLKPVMPLTEQRAFVYLRRLDLHLSSYPELLGNQTIEKPLKILMNNLIIKITKKRPTYNALLKQFSDIPKRYKDSRRKTLTQFIADTDYDVTDKMILDRKEDLHLSNTYGIRYGVLLYTMATIEKEYKCKWMFSPAGGSLNNGSDLYKECKRVANINHSDDIPIAFQKKYYNDLLGYLFSITSKQGVPDKSLLKMQTVLLEKMALLIKSETPASNTRGLFAWISSKATEYGVNIAIAEVVSEVSMTTGFLSYVKLLQPEYALIATLVICSLRSTLVKDIALSLNSIAISTLTEPFVITFETLEKFGDFCIHFFSSDTIEKDYALVDDGEFIQLLKRYPIEWMAPDDRNKLKYTVALEESEVTPEQTATPSVKLRVG